MLNQRSVLACLVHAFLVAVLPVPGLRAEPWQTNDFRRVMVVGTNANGQGEYRDVWLCSPPGGGQGILLFPGGRSRAVTLSFDDDTASNRRFVEIANSHQLKATFNLNSGYFGNNNLAADEIKALFAGHEVASHTVRHTGLWNAPDELARAEIMDDRLALERLVGYPVRGMAYPCGAVKQNASELFPALGIDYARGIREDGDFTIVRDPYDWAATCHHSNMLVHAEAFLASSNTPALLYVWGHAYEFDNSGNWDLLEKFGKRVGGRKGIWYATNIEIVDYLNAARHLQVSADGRKVTNPSRITVWLRGASGAVKVEPGARAVAFVPPDSRRR